MNHVPTTIIYKLSPDEFFLGYVALIGREWGEQLATKLERINAFKWFILVVTLAVLACDHYIFAIIFAGVISSAVICFTVDKTSDNFADQLAQFFSRKIWRYGVSVLKIRPTILANSTSHIPQVPTTPPRFTLA